MIIIQCTIILYLNRLTDEKINCTQYISPINSDKSRYIQIFETATRKTLYPYKIDGNPHKSR